MKNSQVSKALRLSLFVQFALILTGGILYCLPNQAGQNFVILLAPFVVGVPLAGQFLQLFPVSSFLTSLPVMMGFGLLANFAVYAGIIYAGMSVRQAMLKMPRLTTN